MDIPFKTSALTPKQWGYVIGGGVLLGLGWRAYSKRKGTTGSQTVAGNSSADVSKLALAGSSAGNLGSVDTTGSTNGSFQLPTVPYVGTDANGNRYLVTGNQVDQLNGSANGGVTGTTGVQPPVPVEDPTTGMHYNPNSQPSQYYLDQLAKAQNPTPVTTDPIVYTGP